MLGYNGHTCLGTKRQAALRLCSIHSANLCSVWAQSGYSSYFAAFGYKQFQMHAIVTSILWASYCRHQVIK